MNYGIAIMHVIRSVVGLSAAFTCLAANAVAQASFHPPIAYSVGTDPEAVAVADFDGDGHLDLVSTVRTPARLSLVRNLGAGAFGPAEFTALDVLSEPMDIVAGDFNGDGRMDLVVALQGVDSIQYLPNLGNGAFGAGVTLPVGDGPTHITKGDWDRDGDDDLAVSNRLSGTVSIVLNVGPGAFQVSQTIIVGVGPRGLASGKFQAPPIGGGSAPLDLVVVMHQLRRITFLTNLGSGAFVVGQTIAMSSNPTDQRPEDVAVADFDEDGDDDVALSISDTTIQDIGLLLQTSPNVFAPMTYYPTGAVHPVGLVAADLDRDGRMDVAVANSATNFLSVLLNIGGGQLGVAETFALLGPAADFVAAGDLDRNGYLDLIATNDQGNSVSVLLSSSVNPQTYCTGAPNTAGAGARISSTGSVSIAANDLVLHITGAPALVNGLFFLGQTAQATPYYGGIMCVGQPIARVGPTQMTNANGATSRALDLGMWPMATITDGAVRNFQFWYRDPTSSAGAANFSDALRVVFTQ